MTPTPTKNLTPAEFNARRDDMARAMYAVETNGGVLDRETLPVLIRFQALAAAAMRFEGYAKVEPVRGDGAVGQ